MVNETPHAGCKQSVVPGDPPDDLRDGLCDRVVLDGDDQQHLPVSYLRCLRGNAAADLDRALPVSTGVENLGEEQTRLHNADRLNNAVIDLLILGEKPHPPQTDRGCGIKGTYDLRRHVCSSFRAIRKARHFRVEPDRGKKQQ